MDDLVSNTSHGSAKEERIRCFFCRIWSHKHKRCRLCEILIHPPGDYPVLREGISTPLEAYKEADICLECFMQQPKWWLESKEPHIPNALEVIKKQKHDKHNAIGI